MISVIIPVYNGEKYISECIESVLKQTFRDFEIIVINDGSTDNTAEICRKFKNIRYFYQENKGVSKAREKGLQVSKGEYITFIDSDDTIKSDFLETMLCEMENCDIVCCNSIDEIEYKSDIYINEDEILTDKERIYKDYFSLKRYTTCIWGKLFKRSILDKVEFPQMEYAEDTFVVQRYFEICGKIKLLRYAGYFYRDNEHGKMHGFMGVREKLDMLKCSLYICEECIKYPSVVSMAKRRLTESLFDLLVHFDMKNEIVEKAFALAEKRSLKGMALFFYRHLKIKRKGLKIGIYTFQDYENYGNRLQNYAVHYIFSQYGNVYNFGNRFCNFKYLAWRLTNGKIAEIFKSKNYRVYKLADFSRKMKYSRKKADICVYGSDQIFNPYYSNEFLINPRTKNNIAFCASFGIGEIPKDNIFREGLPKFDFVSFREKRGAEMYFEIMGKNAEILLEPVMYVSKEHWRSLEKCPKGFENRSYIFEYFIDENREQWSVEEFLYLIDHAEKVVTNSYHACVFAIIFGKPFTVTEREGISMQSRFDTLLKKAESGIDFEVERRKIDKFIMSALEDIFK